MNEVNVITLTVDWNCLRSQPNVNAQRYLACQQITRIGSLKGLNNIALRLHTSELQDVTCHMGSHSVTCHPTQVNAPRLTQPERLVLH